MSTAYSGTSTAYYCSVFDDGYACNHSGDRSYGVPAVSVENAENSKNGGKEMGLIVNLFGVPGAGKSTGAAYIFSQLKMKGINCELVTEFAKDKVWENTEEVFKNQAYIFGKQSFKISRCADKVDVVITDSPLPLSIFYNHDDRLTENFNNAVMDFFNSYDNLNYFLKRTKPYNASGRLQTEEESDRLAQPMMKLFKDRGINILQANGDIGGYEYIINDIKWHLYQRGVMDTV